MIKLVSENWRVSIPLAVLSFLLGVALLSTTGQVLAQDDEADGPLEYDYAYLIDRFALPPLASEEITLDVRVGNALAIELTDQDGANIPFERITDEEIIRFTTDAEEVLLSFTSEDRDANIGTFTIPPLKYGKDWAWSHSFEGIEPLDSSISLFEAAGIRGTIFVMPEFLDNEESPDYFSTDTLSVLIGRGWSVGNQTFNDINCAPIPGGEEATIEEAQRILTEIATLARADYPITMFSSPCSLRSYDLAFENIRRAGESTLLFNESGGLTPLTVEENLRDETVDDEGFAFPLDIRQPLGRDLSIELGDPEAVIGQMDWVSSRSEPFRHIWYTTASTGNDLSDLSVVLNYIVGQYGEGGDDSVWIAPSDEVAAYLLLAQNVSIDITTGSINATPFAEDVVDELNIISKADATSTPVNTPTGTPTATATATATSTPLPTITPSATPTTTPTATFTPIPVQQGASGVEVALVLGIGLIVGGGIVTLAILGLVIYLIFRNNDQEKE